MSLLRLLTAGKSLVGLKSSEPRYLLSKPQGLPRFNPKKNPFRATTLPDSVQSAPAPAVRNESCKPECANPQPVKLSSQESPLAVASKRASAGRAWCIGLLQRATGSKRWAASQNCAKGPKRRSSRPMVQPELSLEKVRVMRNDLSETDLEIVHAKPAIEPEVNPGTPNPAPKANPRPAWMRVTSRLFGAGKT